MDRAKLSTMRESINNALAEVVEGMEGETGGKMTLRLGNVTFSTTGFRGTIICEEKEENTGLPSRYKTDWNEAVGLGLVDAEWYGVETLDRGTRYKVVGWDFKKRKNNVMLQRQDNGKIYITGMRHFKKHPFAKSNLNKGLTLVDRP